MINSKTVAELLKSTDYIGVVGDEKKVPTSLAYDSRDVKKKSAFFALKGIHTDGHNYIEKAIKSGATVIFHSDVLTQYNEDVLYVLVKNTQTALSSFSSAFWGFPSKEIKIVGVTGTDGKSSTVSFIHQLLTLEDEQSGFLSTVSFQKGDVPEKNNFRQSTPNAPEIHQALREMIENGKEYAIIEATSHGLSEKTSRLADVEFDAAVYTNLSHEHLEFHGTLEQYRSDKANLFRNIARGAEDSFGVVNLDSEHADYFIEAAGEKAIFTYGINNLEADLTITEYNLKSDGIDFTLKEPQAHRPASINLPGSFNMENILASLLVVSELIDEDVMDLAEHLPKIKAVEGRMAVIDEKQPFSVIVDYAHSPGSFEKVFPIFKEGLKGRLISVFGSAGERDIDKRPIQGEIASRFSDIVILSDEDPREEDSMTILEDIASGIKDKKRDESLFLIPDRKEAIRKALNLAKKDDLVVTLGKGHEGSIIYKDGSIEWNESEVVRELLKGMKY